MTFRRSYAPKKRMSMTGAMQALKAAIIMAHDLDRLDAESLARTHNVARTPGARLKVVREAIAQERERRAA